MMEIRDPICTSELLKGYRKKLALFFLVSLKNTKETLKVRALNYNFARMFHPISGIKKIFINEIMNNNE